MSVTHDIYCKDCKESLWIGQKDYIYTGKKHINELKDFLFKHATHHLIFACSDFIIDNYPDDNFEGKV